MERGSGSKLNKTRLDDEEDVEEDNDNDDNDEEDVEEDNDNNQR